MTFIQTHLAFILTYLTCALGIVVSVLLPILWQAVYRYFPRSPTAAIQEIRFWDAAIPYLLLGVTSLATALLVVAFLGDTLADFKAALLAGYAWDSTLQKLRP